MNPHNSAISNVTNTYVYGAIVIVWLMDLQLPMQSVPITTNIVSSNPAQDELYSIQHYVIKVLLATCNRPVVFSGYSGFLHE